MLRWEPLSEGDIVRAIDEGALTESSSVDVKRLTGDSDGDRKETARDLASFAIDGGALLIGVDEDKPTRRFELAPQPLAGLAEKVELIALQRVDPPLHVRCREIESATEAGRGYLWVDVPPSPDAPHMVGGVYYARGDRVRRRLGDAEVLRLHERRRSASSLAGQALTDEMSRDHVRPEHRENGHLWVAALPLTAPRELAVPLVAAEDHRLLLATQLLDQAVPERTRGYAPATSSLSSVRRVADGASLHSYVSLPGRILRTEPTAGGVSSESALVELTVREDGGVRLTLGRASLLVRGAPRICDGLIHAWTIRVIAMAAYVAEQTGYRGSWGLAMRVDRLHGGSSAALISFDDFSLGQPPVYDRDGYGAETSAMTVELVEQPRVVADRLLAGLLRALGSAAVVAPPGQG